MTKQMPSQIMQEIVELCSDLLVPFMKIRRDVPFPTEHLREETDGEHAYSLAMIAITLNNRMKLKLNDGLIAQYALVHDLVVVYAGDLSARTATQQQIQQKSAKEHKAYIKIKNQFSESAGWIPSFIHEYELRARPEARFVFAVDKMLPALLYIVGGGKGWNQRFPIENDKLYFDLVSRLRQKVQLFPELSELFEVIIAHLTSNRQHYANLPKNS